MENVFVPCFEMLLSDLFINEKFLKGMEDPLKVLPLLFFQADSPDSWSLCKVAVESLQT